jgi:dTMP kinase
MTQHLPNGLVVLFEGIDGVGKSTQLDLAAQTLRAEGFDVANLRNLGGTPIGEALRTVMLSPIERPGTTDLYISVAIQEALVHAIAQERAAGRIVLLDRSPLSLAAYAIFGGGVPESLGWQYVQSGMDQIAPELILVYKGNLPIVIERARKASGTPDYFESKPLSYFESVSHGYDVCTERFSAVTVNADQSVHDVQVETMQHIRQLIAHHA